MESIMKWRTGFARAKRSLGRAYETSKKILSVTDRVHGLLSQGYNVVQDQLEPELRRSVGGALQTYARRRQTLANVDTNLREIGANVQRAFPEYLA